MPILNNISLVPWEVILVPDFTVSAYGFTTTKRITTNSISVETNSFITEPENIPQNQPTPTDYEAYVELVNEALKQINDLSVEAEQVLDQAKQYNEQSQQAATNAEASAQQAEASSQSSQTSAQNAESSAQNASNSASSAQNSASEADTYAQNAKESETKAERYSVSSQNSASEAQQYSSSAQESAEQANQSSESAQQYASNAEASANNAAQSAETAKEYSDNVVSLGTQAVENINSTKEAAIQEITQSKDGALTDINSAQTGAISAISQAQQTAVSDITDKGTEQVNNINSAGNTAVQAVQAAQTIAVQAVQTAQTEGVKAVNDAGNAKIKEIETVNALVPTPTPEDAGKVVVVKPDGTGYELGNVQADSYTKAESDARYAPIASALKVKCNSTGIGTLTPTVAWRLQSLLIGGRTTQDGTPSPESPAPLANAGRDGELDITITGVNLFNYAELIQNRAYNADGKLVNTAGYMSTPQMPVCPGKPYRVNTNNANAPAAIWVQFDRAGNLLSREASKPSNYTETLLSNAAFLAITFYGNLNASWLENAIVSVGAEEVPYTPYQGIQALPIPTPNGLPGIPVDSGGNWTDEKGQQWICDTIDREAGLWTHKCKSVVLSSAMRWGQEAVPASDGDLYLFTYDITVPVSSNQGKPICNYASYIVKNASGVADKWSSGKFTVSSSGFFEVRYSGTLDEWKAYIDAANPPIEVLTFVDEPYTTQLSAEELAALNALQSYDGTTNIVAPDAMIQASAVADATEYINQQIANAIAIAKV